MVNNKNGIIYFFYINIYIVIWNINIPFDCVTHDMKPFPFRFVYINRRSVTHSIWTCMCRCMKCTVLTLVYKGSCTSDSWHCEYWRPIVWCKMYVLVCVCKREKGKQSNNHHYHHHHHHHSGRNVSLMRHCFCSLYNNNPIGSIEMGVNAQFGDNRIGIKVCR